jgi:hypothetical protein
VLGLAWLDSTHPTDIMLPHDIPIDSC